MRLSPTEGEKWACLGSELTNVLSQWHFCADFFKKQGSDQYEELLAIDVRVFTDFSRQLACHGESTCVHTSSGTKMLKSVTKDAIKYLSKKSMLRVRTSDYRFVIHSWCSQHHNQVLWKSSLFDWATRRYSGINRQRFYAFHWCSCLNCCNKG